MASKSTNSVSKKIIKLLKEDERIITNVVMMGMGEPLANYKHVVHALEMMLDDTIYGLSQKKSDIINERPSSSD